MTDAIENALETLRLPYSRKNYQPLAKVAGERQWSCVDYLDHLLQGEVAERDARAITRRIQAARFPIIKTLENFQWSWPKSIDRAVVQDLFRLKFMQEATPGNVIFIGNVGVGKTHLATALGHRACLQGHSVLFTTAVDIINSLSAAQSSGRLKQELARYTKPTLLVMDELGYLPVDKLGADLLFQIISQRYERVSTVVTSNRVYKNWSGIFNNDSTLTSAILDRLLHHAQTIIIEGKSYRTREAQS